MRKKASFLGSFRLKPAVISLAAGVLGFILIYLVLTNVVTPKRYTLVVGEIAQSTITATKAVEDEVTTRANIDRARASVDSMFKRDDGVAISVSEDVAAALQTVADYRSKYQKAANEHKTVDMPVYMPPVSMVDEFIQALNPMLLTRTQAQNVLLVSDGSFTSFSKVFVQLIESAMESGISEREQSDVCSRIVRDLQSAYFTVDTSLVPLASTITAELLRPNMHFDEEGTSAARDQAENEVVPTTYKKGQNVVVANEIVTQAQYEVIAKLGLLEDDSVDVSLYLGLALVVVLVFLQLLIYMLLLEKDIINQPRLVLLVITVFIVILGVGIVFRGINVYLIPMQLGVFLFALLLNQRFAIVCNTSLAVLVGVLATGEEGLFATGMFNILLVSVISGTLSAMLVRKTTQRLSIVYSGLIVAVMNFAVMLGIGLMTTARIEETLISATYSAGSAILSAVFAMALAPILENIFDVVTPQKLMEISNPNNPLLRRLQTETPGTYHHSLIVANLAEAAARSIGADDLLVRVGAYFHDVGKLKHPLMFKENQISGENPHDTMDPYVSAAVITDHTRDGVILAQKHKLPKGVEDIIRQHHGRSAAAYFYITAIKRAEEAGLSADSVDKMDFSYDGPKPSTREAAIVFMADTVEAATRSMKTHSKEDIEQMVRKLIKAKLQDGQLDDAPLTLRELETITQTFLFVLGGFYHDRIAYPELENRDQRDGHVPPLPMEGERQRLKDGGA